MSVFKGPWVYHQNLTGQIGSKGILGIKNPRPVGFDFKNRVPSDKKRPRYKGVVRAINPKVNRI
jgi:hypothetical protein